VAERTEDVRTVVSGSNDAEDAAAGHAAAEGLARSCRDLP
jgi:hypothetical protein